MWCVLHRGQRGEVWCVSSTLCRYDIRMGLLLVRSWARVRRVSLGGGEFGRGDLGCVLMYEFVMVALQQVCLYYASVYLCLVC